MSDPSHFLLITECEVQPNKCDKIISEWHTFFDKQSQDKSLYVDREKGALVELHALRDLSQLSSELLNNVNSGYAGHIVPFMESDWRRQVLELKNVVIAQKEIVPKSAHLQLRYIEVPLKRYQEYENWRQGTIFNYAKKKPQISSFLAYHTLLSAKPGVVFVCGFDCPIAEYLSIYSDPEFQKISSEAKAKYIYNGPNGLFTQVYQRV